jgi:hypothetical protein
MYYCRWPDVEDPDCEKDGECTHRFTVFIPDITGAQEEDSMDHMNGDGEGNSSKKKGRKSSGPPQRGALFHAYNHQVHEAVGSLRRIDPSQPVYKNMPVTYMGKTTNMDVKAVDWLAPLGTPLFYCHGRTPYYNEIFFMWWDDCFVKTFRNILPTFAVKSSKHLLSLLDLALTWCVNLSIFLHQPGLTGSDHVLDSPDGSELKIISSQLLHIADRSFYLGPFANQRELDAGADSTGRHPADRRIHFLNEMLSDHDAPAKGTVASARQQLETHWLKYLAAKHRDLGTDSEDGEASPDGEKASKAPAASSGRCATPPP